MTKLKLRALNRYSVEIFGPCTPSPVNLAISERCSGRNKSGAWAEVARQLQLDDGSNSKKRKSSSDSGDGGNNSSSGDEYIWCVTCGEDKV